MGIYGFMEAASATALADLLEHLDRTTGMEKAVAVRVVEEVLTYFAETVEAFVARRHAELQGEHLKNEDIFERIGAEMQVRRFAAPEMTKRQIRRIVYG